MFVIIFVAILMIKFSKCGSPNQVDTSGYCIGPYPGLNENCI